MQYRRIIARPTNALIVLVIVSFGIRLMAIQQGGQFWSPDESRYLRSTDLVDNLFEGNIGGAAHRIFRYTRHNGFTWIGVIPASIHRVVFGLDAKDKDAWNAYWSGHSKHFESDYRFSAIFFALPSALSLAILYAIARAAGAGEGEALLGAFLLAASNAMFAFSRHFAPYDSSLLIALIAVYGAIRARNKAAIHSIWLGTLIFFAFWIYHGHVLLTVVIGLVYSVFLASSFRATVARMLGMCLGAALIFVPVFAYSLSVASVNVIEELLAFSQTVKQGGFDEGIIFPFMYFHDVETGVALVWLCGIVFGLRALWIRPQDDGFWRGRLWLACLLSLYLLMTMSSTALQIFVLYGRTARSLIPFIALFCAFAFARPLAQSRLARIAFVALVCCLAAPNFLSTLQQQFPREVARQIYSEYDDISFETTFPIESRLFQLPLPARQDARYALVNASFYYPIAELGERPAGDVLIEIPHPHNLALYQYEGISPAMRDIVKRDGIYIWLIDRRANGA